MKIRLHGTEDECCQAAQRLGEIVTMLPVSDPYPDRGRSVLVRVYVEARLPEVMTGERHGLPAEL